MAFTTNRRQLFASSAGAALAGLTPPSWAQAVFPQRRWINIVFTPTGEHSADRYFWDGAHSMAAVHQFSWTCWDFRANEWKWIHPWLMDPRVRLTLEV
jgi:uncharacterized protein YcbK (DUF882 family)